MRSREEVSKLRAEFKNEEGLVDKKGSPDVGESRLYYHTGMDVWSVAFSLPGTVTTWVALPNENIARGAYAGGPPYVDSPKEGG